MNLFLLQWIPYFLSLLLQRLWVLLWGKFVDTFVDRGEYIAEQVKEETKVEIILYSEVVTKEC